MYELSKQIKNLTQYLFSASIALATVLIGKPRVLLVSIDVLHQVRSRKQKRGHNENSYILAHIEQTIVTRNVSRSLFPAKTILTVTGNELIT
jgi:hypothetical protein